MRQLLVIAAIAGLAVAKPEMYREKEDFQYSRSSSDEGSKAGYYGAQRGNMGGNYEKAHNMDALAQNQMSGLVRTVEGELGDGAKQHTGSVYTAAKSSGVYGSKLDLSNLEGRNFHEGTSYGDSNSHFSSHSSEYKNQHTAGYTDAQVLNAGFDRTLSQNTAHNGYGTSHSLGSGYGRYNGGANSDQSLYSTGHQSSNLESASQYEDRNTASHNSVDYSQAAGYQGQFYDQGSSLRHGSNIYSRLYPSGTPVKILVRPGTRVTIPVAAQTYDGSQSSSFDQNAINRDAEILNSNGQEKPKAKNYESSYSYRKEWEKHDTKPISGAGVMPLAIPTLNPYPVNSELYEDAQASILQQQRNSGMTSQSHHSSHSGYNSASANLYNTQHHTGSNSGIKAYHGAYNGGAIGANTDTSSAYNNGASGSYIGATNGASSLNLVDDASTKPKSYQSSYSYHKSWEHQGDPYVILPTRNGDYEQTSGKLTAGSLNQGAYGSHQYGSHSHQHSHQGYNSQSSDDCDENGHIRRVRSANRENFGQQTQNEWQQFGQQNQKLRDELGQQTHDSWQQFRQQTQKQREELGQHTQDAWQQFGQQTQKQREELGQRTRDAWQQFGQQTQNQREKLEDFGHQTQNTRDPFFQQNQNQRGGLGQEIQDTWQQLGQHTQTQNDRLEAFGHQTPNTWDQLNQQTQKQEEELSQRTDNAGHVTRNKWDKLVDDGQQTLRRWGNQLDGLGQQTHDQWSYLGEKSREKRSSNWDKLEDLGQQTQNTWDPFVQQNQNQRGGLGQEIQDTWQQLGQQTQTQNDRLEAFGHQTQNTWDQLSQQTQKQEEELSQRTDNAGHVTRNKWDKLVDNGQQTLRRWGNQLDGLGQQTHDQWSYLGEKSRETRSSNWDKLEDLGQQTQNTWGQFDQESQKINDQLEYLGQETENKWGHDYEGLVQHTLNTHDQFGQQSQNTWDKLEPQSPTDLGQQTQDSWTGQEIYSTGNHDRQTEQKPSTFDASSHRYHGMNFDQQSSDSTYEIMNLNNEEKHVTHSHTLEKDNKNKTHHVHSIWDEIKKEEIGQESEDTVEDLSQTADQQTQVTWDSMNHKENRPWYQNTVETAHGHLTNRDDTLVTPNPHPWMYNQVYHHHSHKNNSASSNQFLTHHSSSSSQSHSWEGHSTNTNADSNVQTHSTGSMFGSSITSLWDKLSDIEKHSIPSHETDQHTSITNSFGTHIQQNENGNTPHNPTSHNVFDIQTRPVQNNLFSIKSTTALPNTEAINKIISSDVERGDITEVINENIPSDVGRGDIGPENSNEQSKPDQSKVYETPEKINSLSLTKESNKTSNTNIEQNNEEDRDLGVISLDQQQWAIEKSDSRVKISSTTQRNNHDNHKPYNLRENLRPEPPFENQDQQNFDQQAFSDQFEFGQETEQQQNTGQQIVDFGQQSENFGLNEMESQTTRSFRQAKVEDLGQQNEPFDQDSLSGWKPNENLEQQSQTGWSENTEDQQVQTAWQPESENLQQQSQLTDIFSQSKEDLSQQVQNIGHGVSFHQGNNQHKTEDLSQQNEQFDQGSHSSFKPDEIQKEHQVNWSGRSEDLGQQSQSGWTEIMEDQQVQSDLKPEDLQQQSQSTHTFESIENLDQQVQTAWKPTEDLQQQSQLTHKFEPVENLDQQVQTAWKPTEDLQQQSQLTHKFESMENLDQQVQTSWKPTDDLQQQSQLSNTFSQMEHNVPPTSNHKPEVSEELIVPKKVATIDSPPEVEVTEKPGFWKSVGNKFTNAKDKVSSWFSRS